MLCSASANSYRRSSNVMSPLSTKESLADVIAALERIDISLDGVAQSLSSSDRHCHDRSRDSRLELDDRTLHKVYNTMLDAHAIIYRHKHNLEVKLARNKNHPKFVIGDKVKIVHAGDRKNNNGRCGYVSGTTPHFLYIVLYRARGKPQAAIKKVRKFVAHVVNIEDESIDSFFSSRSNNSGER